LLNQIEQQLQRSNNKNEELNEFERANVRLARKFYDRKVKVPKELIEKSSKLSSDAYHIWVDARKNNEWNKFAPFLRQWLDLRKQISQYITPSSSNLYNTCIDEYEPGLNCERIDQIFSLVKENLIPLIQKIERAKDNGRVIDNKFLTSSEGLFDVTKQEQLSRSIAAQIGFDFQSGRLDVSVHPFTISPTPGYDVRITTRYSPNEFFQGLAATIHEAGHALYEANLPSGEHANLPISNALSMGVHESQSLFWERHVALSKTFFKKHWGEIKHTFPHLSDSITYNDMYLAANTVRPIFIRTESDEVTYPLHVILRYEIEKGLFDGSISVDELPMVWNNKMREYLGICPPTDSEGVLQDVHWTSGSFGYFPTYLLGSIMAAQLAAKLPNFERLLEASDYKQIKNYLTEKIHKRGSVDLNADKLLEYATGEPLNPKYFIDYLTKKYSEIYQL
jgi:carboxypeptidase Taq